MNRFTGVHLAKTGNHWKAWWWQTDGKRKLKCIGMYDEMSRRQAAAVCRNMEADLSRNPGLVDAGAAPTLAVWLDRYLAQRIHTISPVTAELYRDHFKRLLRFFGPDRSLDSISRSDAADWQAWIAAGKSTAKGHPLSAASVARHVRQVKTVFLCAFRQNVIQFSPFDRLSSAWPKNYAVRPWRHITPEELRRLLDACPDDAWRALLLLGRLAGLRRGEALALYWCDVDWTKHTITVKRGKTGARTLPMIPALHDELSLLFTRAAPGQLKPTVGIHDQHNLLRTLKAIRVKAGVDDWGPGFHTLRKCCATDLRNLGYPEYAVDAWLGHSMEIARIHYVRPPEDLFARAAGLPPQK